MKLPPHALFAALTTDYAYGLETGESHHQTVETFGPWVSDYLKSTGLQPALSPLPTDRIFFTNVFVTRVGW